MHNSRSGNEGPSGAPTGFNSKRVRDDNIPYDTSYDNSTRSMSAIKRPRSQDRRSNDCSGYYGGYGQNASNIGDSRDYSKDFGQDRYASQYYNGVASDNSYYNRGDTSAGRSGFNYDYRSSSANDSSYGRSYDGNTATSNWDSRDNRSRTPTGYYGSDSYQYPSNYYNSNQVSNWDNPNSGSYARADGNYNYSSQGMSNRDKYYSYSDGYRDPVYAGSDYDRGESRYSDSLPPPATSAYYKSNSATSYINGRYGNDSGSSSYFGNSSYSAYDMSQRYDYNLSSGGSSYYQQNRNNASAGIGSTYYNKFSVSDKSSWNNDKSENSTNNAEGFAQSGFRKTFYTPRVYSFGAKKVNKAAIAAKNGKVNKVETNGDKKSEEPEVVIEPAKVVTDPDIKHQAQLCFSVIDHHFANVLAKLNVKLLNSSAVQSIPSILGLNNSLTGYPEPVVTAPTTTELKTPSAAQRASSVESNALSAQPALKPLIVPLMRQTSTSSVTSRNEDTSISKISNNTPNSANTNQSYDPRPNSSKANTPVVFNSNNANNYGMQRASSNPNVAVEDEPNRTDVMSSSTPRFTPRKEQPAVSEPVRGTPRSTSYAEHQTPRYDDQSIPREESNARSARPKASNWDCPPPSAVKDTNNNSNYNSGDRRNSTDTSYDRGYGGSSAMKGVRVPSPYGYNNADNYRPSNFDNPAGGYYDNRGGSSSGGGYDSYGSSRGSDYDRDRNGQYPSTGFSDRSYSEKSGQYGSSGENDRRIQYPLSAYGSDRRSNNNSERDAYNAPSRTGSNFDYTDPQRNYNYSYNNTNSTNSNTNYGNSNTGAYGNSNTYYDRDRSGGEGGSGSTSNSSRKPYCSR